MNVVFKVRVNQFAVRDVHLIFQGHLGGWLQTKNKMRAHLRVRCDGGIGGAIGEAVDITSDAEHLRRFIAETDLRPHRFDPERAGWISDAALECFNIRFHQMNPWTQHQSAGRREIHVEIKIAQAVPPNNIGSLCGGRGPARALCKQALKIPNRVAGETRVAIVQVDVPPVLDLIGETLV